MSPLVATYSNSHKTYTSKDTYIHYDKQEHFVTLVTKLGSASR